MRKKVTVVGAGNVGASCAVWLASKEVADVVLVDVVDGVPQGKGLDLMQAGPVEGFDVTITGANRAANRTDAMAFNINLTGGTLPQLPASTYTGTLNIQAQATP